MIKVLLLGGSGFIGRNILEQLSSDYQIFAPSSQELNLLDAEEVEKYLSLHNFDIVIHAANYGGNRSQAGLVGVFETNKKMFLNLTKNFSAFGRMIFLGSGAEYDKSRSLMKVKESEFGIFQPKDDYGRVKYFASEQIADMPGAVNLRCFGVFGKYEDYSTRFISNAICRALSDLPILVRQNTVFDYLYVNDLVRIIKHFIENEPKHKFYNTGTGKGIELAVLAKIIKELTGTKLDIEIKNAEILKEYTCDNSLLLKELDAFQFTMMSEAVKKMMEWYRQNLSSINKSLLNFDA